MGLPGEEDFERRIYVKLSAADALRGQLGPGILRGRPVALGTATDPYQPAEMRFGITRTILEVLSGCPDLELCITTKSPLILRDLALLQQIRRDRKLSVNLSITTLLPPLSRLLEGRAPSPGAAWIRSPGWPRPESRPGLCHADPSGDHRPPGRPFGFCAGRAKRGPPMPVAGFFTWLPHRR